MQTQQELLRFGRTENAYYSVAVSHDGMRVAGGSGNKYIKIWDAVTGQEVAMLRGFQGIASYLAFLPDGNTLVSGAGENPWLNSRYKREVRLWRAPSWEEIEAAEKSTEGKTH